MPDLICGHPTASGPCRRPVAAPGAPCGARHRPLPAAWAAFHSSPAAPGGDPLGQSLPSQDPVRLDHRQLTARRHDTPAHALAALASDPHPDVRIAVAANPNTPPEVIARLAADPATADPATAESLLRAAARNAACPPETLAALAGNEARRGAFAALDNPNCPPETLALHAASDDPQRRYRVARNWSTPPETLTRLAADPDRSVRRAAKNNLATPPAGHAAAALLEP